MESQINRMQNKDTRPGGWVVGLNDEDRAFLKRFVLASGSLKQTAEAYGISYPTVRIRLDRLIDKIKVWDRKGAMSTFERVPQAGNADGKSHHGTAKALLPGAQAK